MTFSAVTHPCPSVWLGAPMLSKFPTDLREANGPCQGSGICSVYHWPPLQGSHGDDSLPFFQEMTRVQWPSSLLWSQHSCQQLSVQRGRSKSKFEKHLIIISEVLKYMKDFDTEKHLRVNHFQLYPSCFMLKKKIAYPTASESSSFCFFLRLSSEQAIRVCGC